MFGLFGGLTALSGQAYIQIAIVALAPTFAVLFFTNVAAFRSILTRLVQATLIAVAVASIQLLPTLRWWELAAQDTDYLFPRAQQFRFVPTNLVVNDPEFYSLPILDREGGYPGLYSNYIGWLALTLAVVGLVYLSRRSVSQAVFLGSFIAGSLWLSSGTIFQWLANWDGHREIQNFAAGVRTPSNMANLAVPAIVGLTSLGLQCLIDGARRWHQIRLRIHLARREFRLGLSLAVLVPVLALLMVRNVANEGRIWMALEDWGNNYESQVAESLMSDELRWIYDTSFNPRLMILAPTYHLKIASSSRPWWIDDKFLSAPGVT